MSLAIPINPRRDLLQKQLNSLFILNKQRNSFEVLRKHK